MTINKYSIVDGIKIYSINYLINEELTENDLVNLFDNNSLIYSIIIGMYEHIHSKKHIKDIIKNIRKDSKWLSKNQWTINERESYENKLTKVFKNIYSYNDYIAKIKAEWYMTLYGFNLK